MNVRPKKHLWIPMLALSMTLAMAAAGSAQAANASLQINFGSSPHWVGVPGTQVREIRQGDHTDYDMFRYGNRYYAYNSADARWYMSRRARGRFVMIDDRSVPSDMRRIPRNYWRNYPASWEDRNDSRYGGTSGTAGTFQVSFGSTPHWAGVSGTRVEVVSGADRPAYDVFRYGGTYYAYNNNRWYSSTRDRGDYTMIQDRSVPTELSRVPREQWHNYPTTWGNQNGDPGANDNGPGNSRGGKDHQNRGRGHN
jgi:hypothetical protein